ncbi:MAG TPA: ComEC/Rec2 family competence protein [Patescibacteria group bacterium]|nr:ComEC/Rec2 family competence protein [Patescibacteria group bacterium]
MRFSLPHPVNRPLSVLAAAFCAGVAAAEWFPAHFFAVYLFALACWVVMYGLRNRPLLFGISACVCICSIGCLWCKASQVYPGHHLSAQKIIMREATYTVKGFVDDEPANADAKMTFGFRVQQISDGVYPRTCSGRLLVCIGDGKDIDYGQQLLLRGRLHTPFGAGRFRRAGYGQYLRRQGIWYILNVQSEADVVRLADNKGSRVKKFALQVKRKMQEAIFERVSFSASGLVAAMILGDKSRLSRFIYESMVKTGTVHILVVSGSNVGIVSFALNLLLKSMRLSRRIRFAALIPLLVLYCLVTGASTPVVRATVMAIVFLSAYFVRRQPDIYNAMALAGLLIVGFNPGQLFDIGFQLSFASVFAIVCIYPKLKACIKPGWLKIKGARYLLEAGLVSCSAWLATAGLVAYYFKIFSPVTVLANLIIVPLAAVITLCGFILIASAFCCPILAGLFGLSAELFVKLLLWCNALLLALPGASFRFA